MRKGGASMDQEVKYSVCIGCGEVFMTKSDNANYCSQACKIQGRYQSRFEVKKEQSRHENMKDILHIQKLAKEEGLTYGQYVAKHRLYGSEVFKKK